MSAELIHHREEEPSVETEFQNLINKLSNDRPNNSYEALCFVYPKQLRAAKIKDDILITVNQATGRIDLQQVLWQETGKESKPSFLTLNYQTVKGALTKVYVKKTDDMIDIMVVDWQDLDGLKPLVATLIK